MDQSVMTIGDVSITLGMLLMGAAVAAFFLLLAILLATLRGARERAQDAATRDLIAQELEERIGELTRIQAEMTGRMQGMGESLAGRQAELAQVVGDRLDAVTHRLGQSMETTTRHTAEGLRHLHERLALIDGAQKNLSELTSQVSSLREVLANKQARGAFGQARMEAIIRDGLPSGAYAFQFTLSSGQRPDCVVFLPDQRPLVIDAKFPLEAITAVREAKSDDDRRRAGQRLRQDIGKHIADIARYIEPGETQDTALMFVPSESVYADLYDGFDDLVQKAYRARVVLVSPSLLMLAIQVIQQIQKDSRMREAAHLIQTEVAHLMGDIGRLRERIVRLEKHFGQANEDIRQILVSSDKIERRATRIEEMEFEQEASEPESGVVIPAPLPRKLQAGE